MKILTLLKHIFIPHDKNDFKPHFFRELSVSLLLFISVFLLGSSAGTSFFIHKTVLGAEIASSVLIDLTNQSRIAENKPPLIRNEKLDQAATLKGDDMASKEYFAHTSPEGITPWYWFNKVGYTFLYAGENLGINFTDSNDLENAWMNSPAHKANIMNIDFQEIGIGTVKGVYNNYPTIYVVQMFGTPAHAVSIEGSSQETIAKKETPTKATLAITKTGEGRVEGVTMISTSSKKSPEIETLVDTNDFTIAKNVSTTTLAAKVISPFKKYSTWYQKVIFKAPHYVQTMYAILLLLIAFALVTMILIEVKKQHYKHIVYGLALLIILTLFTYINQLFY